MSNMQIPEKEKFKQKLSNELPAPPSSRESYWMRTVNYSTVPAPMCTALTDIRKTTVFFFFFFFFFIGTQTPNFYGGARVGLP